MAERKITLRFEGQTGSGVAAALNQIVAESKKAGDAIAGNLANVNAARRLGEDLGRVRAAFDPLKEQARALGYELQKALSARDALKSLSDYQKAQQRSVDLAQKLTAASNKVADKRSAVLADPSEKNLAGLQRAEDALRRQQNLVVASVQKFSALGDRLRDLGVDTAELVAETARLSTSAGQVDALSANYNRLTRSLDAAGAELNDVTTDLATVNQALTTAGVETTDLAGAQNRLQTELRASAEFADLEARQLRELADAEAWSAQKAEARGKAQTASAVTARRAYEDLWQELLKVRDAENAATEAAKKQADAEAKASAHANAPTTILGIRPLGEIVAEANRVRQALRTLKADGTSTFAQIAQAEIAAKNRLQELRREVQGLKQDASGSNGIRSFLLSATAGVTAGGSAVGSITSSVQTGLEYDRIQRGMKAIYGSAAAAAEETAFLRREAERLGTIDLLTASQSYLKLSASARGTRLEGAAVRDVFVGISEAATVLGMNQDRIQGSFEAVSQIISKNVVSLEELRQQLGDRLYGALQIAARASGILAEDLDRLLRTGEVLATDFIPNFARQLRSEFGPAAAEAARSAGAEFGRFKTAVTELQITLANSGLLSGLTEAAKSLTEAFKDPEFQKSVAAFGKTLGTIFELAARHGDTLIKIAAAWAAAKFGGSVGGGIGELIGSLIGGLPGRVIGRAIGQATGSVIAGGATYAGLSMTGFDTGKEGPRENDNEWRNAVAQAQAAHTTLLNLRTGMQQKLEALDQKDEAALQKQVQALAAMEEAVAASKANIQKLYVDQIQASATELNALVAQQTVVDKLLKERQPGAEQQAATLEARKLELQDLIKTLSVAAGLGAPAGAGGQDYPLANQLNAQLARDQAERNLVVSQAVAQAQITRAQADADRGLADLETQLAAGNRTIAEYYAERERLQGSALDAQISAAKAGIAGINSIPLPYLTETSTTAAKEEFAQAQIERTAELIQLEAELNSLIAQRGTLGVTTANEAAEATRQWAQQVRQLNNEIVALSRDPEQIGRAAEEAVRAQYEDFLRSGNATDTDRANVERLATTAGRQADFDTRAQNIQQQLQSLEQQWQTYSAAVEAGTMTEAQAIEQFDAALVLAAPELANLLERMSVLAREIGPEAVMQVQQLALKLQGLSQVAQDPFAQLLESWRATSGNMKEMTADFAQDFTSTLTDAILGAEDAFANLWKAIQRQILQAGIEAALAQVFRGGSSGGGFDFLGLVGSLLGGTLGGGPSPAGGVTPEGMQFVAGGGPITGPGGPTDDKVLTALSNGEFVVKASSVKKLGLPALELINAGRLPVAVARAAGGLIGNGRKGYAALDGAGMGVVSVTINSPIDARGAINGQDLERGLRVRDESLKREITEMLSRGRFR